jgi:hypothetical protein
MGSCEKSGVILYPTQLNRQESGSIILKKKKDDSRASKRACKLPRVELGCNLFLLPEPCLDYCHEQG